jgi:hypothetical protein
MVVLVFPMTGGLMAAGLLPAGVCKIVAKRVGAVFNRDRMPKVAIKNRSDGKAQGRA